MREGWKATILGNVLDIQNGFAFDSKKFADDGDMPLIRIRDLKNGTTTATRYSGEYEAKYVVRAGDLLIGMDGEFACHEWKGGPALLNQRVCRLQDFSSSLLPRFLFYGINKFLKDIEDVTTFTTVKHLSARQIKAIEFPIPPLPEQKRIAAILDEAFAGIATAVENTERNLGNAQDLFDSYLNAVFSQRGKGWVHRPLVKTCQVFTDGDWIETKDQAENGIRLIQTGNVGVGEFKNRANKARFISEETFFRLKCQEVYSRDCLVSRLPDPVGRSCIVPELENRMITAVDCTIIRFDESMVIPEFFNYFSQSSKYIARVEEYCTGATRKRISRRNLGKVEVPTPPVTEQKELVAKFDDLAVERRRLQSIFRQKLNALADLKQSLLQKAFSGELITAPQEEIETALA